MKKPKQEKSRPGARTPDGLESNTSTISITKPLVFRNSRNKVIASVQGCTLKKSLKASKHFLRQPPAIAIDTNILKGARDAGARWIDVVEREACLVYHCSLETFLCHGFEFDRGHGNQMGLEIRYWNVRDPNHPQLFQEGENE